MAIPRLTTHRPGARIRIGETYLEIKAIVDDKVKVRWRGDRSDCQILRPADAEPEEESTDE